MQFSDTLSKILLEAHRQYQVTDKADWHLPPAQGKWCYNEILGHLIDSAHNNHRRFIVAREQKDLVFDGYNQILWVEANQYRNRRSDEIFATFQNANQHIVHLLSSIGSDLLMIQRKHNYHKIGMTHVPASDTSTLAQLIHDYLYHMEHHLSQLFPKYIRTVEQPRNQHGK